MRVRLLAAAFAAAVLPAALAAAGPGVGAVRTRAAPVVRPNVLILETDDQTVESMRVLARVNALLGAEGATFDNSFVTFSLCCPSRATLLTGQYNHNNGVLGNVAPVGGYEKLDSTNTLAVWLQRSGYYTAHLGKYLNQYGRRDAREIPPGWSEWRGSVDPSTYRYRGYTLNEGGTLTTYQNYQTDVYADKAVEIVRRRAPEAQPFFLWVAFLAPHSGQPRDPDDPAGLATPSPAARHKDHFAAEALPMPPSFNEEDVSDKPAGIRGRPRFGPQRIAAIREMYQQRLESLLAVDEAVEKIVGALRDTGELDRTLIVFTSDNGFFHGEHRVPSGKVLLYEPSIRVPLILRGPGVPRGVHVHHLVANIDLAPTILEAAGAKAGRIVDGRSLLPLFRDRGQEWGRDLLIERGPGDATFRALRTPRYLYAEYGNGEQEFYDLAGDPDELQSRHADPAYAPIRAELARRLARLAVCKGAACRAGPAVALRVTCARGRARLAVTGADARWIIRIGFYVRGRRVALDFKAPWAGRISASGRRGAVVRSRIFLLDGRVVTRDARIVCR